MNADIGTTKIFQGVKFFWKTRNSLDVIMIEHGDSNVTELIAYEPTIDKEAPRIYLNTVVLRSRIDQASIDAQVSFAKRNNVPITEEWISGITNKAKADYLLNRLLIVEFSSETKVIKVEVQVSSIAAEGTTDAAPLLCEKPPELNTFRAAHQASLMEGVVLKALEAFETEKKSLQAQTSKASAYQVQATQSGLTARQRWRIPILFVKVSKGRRLSPEDNAIWQHVTSHVRTEEDAVRLTGIFEANLQLPTVLSAPVRKMSTSTTPVVRSNSVSPKNSPKQSPKNSPRPSIALYKATTASSRSKIYGDGQDELDRTPPSGKILKVSIKKAPSKKAMSPKAVSPKAGGKRTPTNKRSGKKRRQSIDGIAKGSSSGDSAETAGIAADELGSSLDDLDDRLARSTIDRFVSTLSAISTSIKGSFSFNRARVVPTDEEEGEGADDRNDDVTPRGAYAQASDANIECAADFPEQVAQYASQGASTAASSQGLTPSQSILDNSLQGAGATKAGGIGKHKDSLLLMPAQGHAQGQAGSVGSVGVVARKRASFLGSFLSLGGFGVSEKSGDSNSTRSYGAGGAAGAGAGAGSNGGSGANSRNGSRKMNVMATVAHLFSGLWGGARKHSSSDLLGSPHCDSSPPQQPQPQGHGAEGNAGADAKGVQ